MSRRQSSSVGRSLFLQALESRAMLAADSSYSEGVVKVVADDDPNQIVAWANVTNDRLSIRVDNQVFVYRNHLVRAIQIEARGGDDTIRIEDSVGQVTRLDGGAGNDAISGSLQHDVISGGSGRDRLSGRAGNDQLEGGPGNDHVGGGAGDDTLTGGPGSDLMRGGLGNDVLYGDGSGEDDNVDPAQAAPNLARALEATSPLQQLAAAITEDAPVELLLTGEATFNDLIFGDAGNDLVRSGPGNDAVFGGAGNDALGGGTGNDFLDGGIGNDRMSGGDHTDILFGGAGDDFMEGDQGDDYLIGGAGHDQLSGGAGDDWMFGDGTNTYPAGITDPVIYAALFANENAGNDTLSGGEGHDRIFGGQGNDRLRGDEGADLLVGGPGADALNALDGWADVVVDDELDTILVDDLDIVL